MKNLLPSNTILVIMCLAITTMAFKCGKPKNVCEDVICTQEFRLFDIVMLDAQKNAFIPNEVRIINAASNASISTFTQNTTNTFTVFSDGNMGLLQGLNVAQSIKVEAIVANVVKASTTLQFSKDCCHVTKISGLDTLIVN